MAGVACRRWWTETSTPTTATYTVTFADVSCLPVTPTDPLVSQSACVGGVVTDPTVAPVAATGVTYTIDPAGPYDGTATTPVTVTATVVRWLCLGSVASWLVGGSIRRRRRFTLTLDAASCHGGGAGGSDGGCRRSVVGVLVPATVTLATTTGITYTMDKTDPYLPLPHGGDGDGDACPTSGVGLACMMRRLLGDRDGCDDGDVPGAVALTRRVSRCCRRIRR